MDVRHVLVGYRCLFIGRSGDSGGRVRPDDAFIKISRRARAGRTPLVKTPHHGIVDGIDTTPSCRTLMPDLPFASFYWGMLVIHSDSRFLTH